MIYILDNDLKKIAEYLDDKSLDNMRRSITQVLCNIHEDTQTPLLKYKQEGILIKSFNKNILEWALWTIKCKANYLYLIELLNCCLEEIFYRLLKGNAKSPQFDKNVKIYEWARDNVPDLPDLNQCDGCKVGHKQSYPSGNIACTKDMYFSLPLVMPNKYLNGVEGQMIFESAGEVVVCRYRNYYQAKLRPRIEKYKEWREDVSCIGTGDLSVSYQSFSDANWTNRNQPEWVKL